MIIIIYDLNKKDVKNKKLLKELFLIIRTFIKKLLKEFIKNLFILIVSALKTFIEKLLKNFKKVLNTNNCIL